MVSRQALLMAMVIPKHHHEMKDRLIEVVILDGQARGNLKSLTFPDCKLL